MITETTRVIEFPCVPWLIDEAGIQPLQGTWTIVPISLHAVRPDIQALIACPHCSSVMPFKAVDTDDIDREHQTGVLTRYDMRCKCGLLFTAKLQEWDKRRLYCVIYETEGLRGTKIHKEYMHAESRESAIWNFAQGHLDHVYKLVDAAPVFGYFGDMKDKDRKEISVD